MKKFVPYISKIIVGIVIITLVVLLFITRKSLRNKTSELNYIQFHDSTLHSVTKSGDSVLTKYTVEYKYLPIDKKKIIDSVLKEQSIKKKNVQTISNIENNVDITKAIGIKDTLQQTYNYHDKYLDYQAIVTPDSLHFLKFNLSDTIWTTTYKDGEQTKFSITHSNKYIHTINAGNIDLVKPARNKHWSIGIGPGYGIGKNGLTPTIGISLQYSLIKF